MRRYCTYFDKSYLPRGITMLRSLAAHEREEYAVFVVCLDELTRLLLRRLDIPNVILVGLHEIEHGDCKLLAAKHDRTLVEYYWTLTPSIILKLMENMPEGDVLTYVDSDQMFFSSPDPIFEELGQGSIYIHPHRFPPNLKGLEINGKYNVGLMSFRNDAHGIDALSWWRDRCIEWCRDYIDGDRYGDQKYLDKFPELFDRVVISAHSGVGAAPWNHTGFEYSRDANGDLFVDGQRLVIYHYHSLDVVNEHFMLPSKHTYMFPLNVVRLCFIPYVDALSRSYAEVKTLQPEFSFGQNGMNLTSFHIFLARKQLAPAIEALKIPQRPVPLKGDWNVYVAPQLCEFENFAGDKAAAF